MASALTALTTTILGVDEDDLGLTPDFEMPWADNLQDIAGWVLGTLFIISGIILAVGIVMFLVARSASNTGGQNKGVAAMVIGIIGIVLLGSVGAFIQFATEIDLFGGDEDQQSAAPLVPGEEV